jgi:hypothetical protein
VWFNTSNGNFNADEVNLANGNAGWNNNLSNTNPVVVCVGPSG